MLKWGSPYYKMKLSYLGMNSKRRMFRFHKFQRCSSSRGHQCTFVIKMTLQLFSDKFFCNCQKLQGLVCYSFIAEMGSPYYKMKLIHVVCFFFFFGEVGFLLMNPRSHILMWDRTPDLYSTTKNLTNWVNGIPHVVCYVM